MGRRKYKNTIITPKDENKRENTFPEENYATEEEKEQLSAQLKSTKFESSLVLVSLVTTVVCAAMRVLCARRCM